MSWFYKTVSNGGSRRVNSFIFKIISFISAILLGIFLIYFIWNIFSSYEKISQNLLEIIKTLSLLYLFELLFLYGTFAEKWEGKIFLILFLPLIPAGLYVSLGVVSLIENESLTIILNFISPNLILHEFYILLVLSIFFELGIRLLSIKISYLKEKIEKNPVFVRGFFVIILFTLATIIKNVFS